MKILFGTDNFFPNVNGAAIFSVELAKGLAKIGHEVAVIAPSRKFKHTITQHAGMTIYGIPSVMIPKMIHPGGIRIPVEINQTIIRAIIEQMRPDIIHIQDHFMIGSRAASLGRKLGIPTVGTNHFLPENFIHYFHPPSFAKKPLSKLAWRQFINVYKLLDLITVPTKTTADLLHSLGLKNPITPISCGVDLKRFNPRNSGSHLKKHYHITDSKLVILFVGRLDKEKNIDLIIKAFAEVQKITNSHLVIAGKGKEKTNLINLSKNLNLNQNVTFTGFVPDKDLAALYRMADLFVIASIAELQSIATMEAMASGLPVIATEVLALPELVHNGKNGYLFNDGDINSLTNHIVKVLKNPALRKKMSQASLKIISQHSLDKTVKTYLQAYESLKAKQ